MFRTFVCFTYLFKNENGVISERRYRRLIIAKLCFHDNGVAIGYELYFEIRWISVFFFFFSPPFLTPQPSKFPTIGKIAQMCFKPSRYNLDFNRAPAAKPCIINSVNKYLRKTGGAEIYNFTKEKRLAIKCDDKYYNILSVRLNI